MSIFSRHQMIFGRRGLLSMALSLLGLITATACADLTPLDPETVRAVVQNVDSLSGEVTVQFTDGTTTTFNLEDIDVEALGGLIGNSSLEAGDEIEIMRDSSDRVRSVTPYAVKLEGTIISNDGRTVTLEAENGFELDLALTAQTNIDLGDDDQARIDDLAPGMLVKVKYNAETNEALKIKLESDDGHDDDADEVKGIITAIDAADHSIAVRDRFDVDGVYILDRNTQINVHGPGRFGQLEGGMEVKLEFGDNGMAVSELIVRFNESDRSDVRAVRDDETNDDNRSEVVRHKGDHDGHEVGELKGVIGKLHPEERAITLRVQFEGAEKYRIGSNTHIDVQDRTDFRDLEVGMLVAISFDRETRVLRRVIAKVEDGALVFEDPSRDDTQLNPDGSILQLYGMITEVHRDAGSISVLHEDGNEEKYSLRTNTKIVMGEPVSYAELETGMLVKIWFDRETRGLVLMHVRMDDNGKPDLLTRDGFDHAHSDDDSHGDDDEDDDDVKSGIGDSHKDGISNARGDLAVAQR